MVGWRDGTPVGHRTLGPGSLAEAACRLLPDKDVSTLRRDFGIDVTDPICSHDGKTAPAPDFRELVD
jgi:hypothetical protein